MSLMDMESKRSLAVSSVSMISTLLRRIRGKMPGKEIDITFKIRHTPEFTKGKLVQEEGGQFRILSSEKLQGIAPGQFGVIYDEEAGICVGSGEITR